VNKMTTRKSLSKIVASIVLLFGFLSSVHSQTLIEQYGLPRVTAMALSPDNTKIALGLAPDNCIPRDAPNEAFQLSAIRILNAQTGEQIQSIVRPRCQINNLKWNSTGTKIAYTTIGPEAAVIVDVATSTTMGLVRASDGGMEGPVSSGVEWSPNDQYIIEFSYDLSQVQILDTTNGDQLSVINKGIISKNVADANWSPNGNYIAIANESGTEIWNVSNIASPQLIAEYTQNSNLIDWSGDGQHLRLATDRLVVINAFTGVVEQTFEPLPRAIIDAQWSPNGQHIATASTDNKIRVWNVSSGAITNEYNVVGLFYPIFDWKSDSSQVIYMEQLSVNGVATASVSKFNVVSLITNTPTPIPPSPTPIPPSPTPTATSVACTHTVVASSTSSLISAIVSANASSTPSTICLGGGTYTLTAVNNSDESANGLPSITKNITIIGNNSVIERATSAPQFRIFRVASNGRLSLNNLTVRGGHAGSLSGGGVRNLGILELNTVIVENNTGNAGGGIRNNNNATFTAINSLIRNNVSTTNGGGLYANNGSSTTLTNTNFLANTTNASNGLGGAIFSNGNVFNMNGGIIQNNSARNGGGIFVNITTQAMSLNGVQFIGNTASNHGAGIYHLSGTTFSVQNGRFTSNIATNEGGAIAGDGTFTISNSNFVSNSANIGGAIHAQATSGSSIQQSCIENNTAPNTIGIFNEATIVLNAQNNFWGSASANGSVNANVNTSGALTTCPNL
jgi:predicted outer membrane repeat protein